MTRRELEHVQTILSRIKAPDEHVAQALAYVAKDLAAYDGRRGQLREQYEYDAAEWGTGFGQ